MPKPLIYAFTRLQKRIVTPAHLYSVSSVVPKDTVTNALWDTGAMISVVSPRIKNELGLVRIDSVPMIGVSGKSENVDRVLVTVELPCGILKRNIVAAVSEFQPDIGIILGMDIITLGDFSLLNGQGRTVFSFTTPPRGDT
jgi:hypothetical protein